MAMQLKIPTPDARETAARIVTEWATANDWRKATDADIDDALAFAGVTYAKQYTGDFPFLQNMQYALQRYGSLSTGQIRGIINCIIAQARKAARPVCAADLIA